MAKTEQTSPPAGMGGTPGLGEAFSINLSTGQGTYSYRIPLPDGIASHTPKLVLEYVHGIGHSEWGLGWRLPMRSICRRLDFGPPGDGLTEHFIDGQDEIVPIGDGSFRAMRETMFARYTRVGDGWRIEERNGVVHDLGLTAAGRVADPAHADRVVEWLVERTTDVSGNSIEYAYQFDQGLAYLAALRYAVYEARFVYEDRPDIRHDGRAGFSRLRARRCAQLRLVLDPGPAERLFRSYEFVYQVAAGSGVSLLTEIRLTANGAAPDGSEDVRRPTTQFRYTGFDPQQFHLRWMTNEGGAPPGLDDPDVALVTLDDAPLPGILINRGGREYYWANRGEGHWAPPRPLPTAPIAGSFRQKGLAFVDMDGSGTADLMVADPQSLQGYYENGGAEGWKNFVAFPRNHQAAPPWTDPNLVLSDTDNDGLIDALASQKRAFVQWRNQGAQGWSAPTMVPKGSTDLLDIDFSDPDVHLSDMTGDGSPDIVRIQSGRVEYWPNLGRGKFGERVAMEHSPRLRRDIVRDTLLFVDVDGDGCDDLVHVSATGLFIYQNQNGMRFADAVVISSLPAPLPGTVRGVNVNGRSGSGLVWNSRTRQQTGYVQFEFAAAQPPYLLTHIENGAGLVSEIFYRSAVEDYRRDRQLGERWTTNFPFPYLVVARTREEDTVSGRVTDVELLYHEGHFERHTRQFQGFRRTERIERGDSSRPDTCSVHHFLMAQERLPGNGPEHSALNGLLSRIETYQLDGSPSEALPDRIETSDHELTVLSRTPDGRARSFVSVSVYRQEDTERTGDSRIEEKTYTYDEIGNVVQETHRGSGTKDGVVQLVRERTTEISYAVSNAHYVLDKPARIVVRDVDGSLLSEKRFYYDGPDFIGLALGQANRGLVSREEEWALTQADFDSHYAGMDQAALGFNSDANRDGVPSVFATSKRQRYDARGILLAARDPVDVESRFGYDASGLFRIQLTDSLGNTQFDYDRATCQITQVTYANGSIARFAYDAQGRILRNALPGEDIANAPTVYSYDETSIPAKRIVRFRQPGGRTSLGITYFDGAGKEFQQRAEVSPGRFLVSALKRLNPWGDLREEFEPSFADTADFGLPGTDGRPSRSFFYDSRGRVVRTLNFNGGVSTAEYQPFRVVLRDANDNDDSPANKLRGQFDTPREEDFDVFRYLVRVVEHRGGPDVVTTYEVGPMGELTTISDGQGVKFRYRYDRRGNRLSILLRESGERKIWYDARREAVRTLDPAGHDLTATWDALGRQTALLQGAVSLEEYDYDSTAQNAFGRLSEVRYTGGRQLFSYDDAGHLLERVYFYEGHPNPHRLQFEYDPLGREIATIHTDGTRIDRELTFNGWLQRIPGVIDSIDYDPRGLPSEIVYKNGVAASLTYTPGRGRIAKQTTTSPVDGVLQDAEFTFDLMDVLLSCNDAAPGASGLREYAYDPLYQLTQLSSVENGNPVVRQYDYAPDYNLRRFDEVRAILHYDDLVHRDRLSGLTPDGGALFAVNYDGNGNLLNLPGQQFAYNAKNELREFTRADGLAAGYSYDHLGFRISKTVTDGGGHVSRILYVSDQAEVRDGVASHFASVGPLRVAVLTGGETRFLHDNGLGSTAFVTNAAGQRIANLESHPFGNTLASNGDMDFRSFSLHPVDVESGLVYMRRRYYSPQLGRFLTPDLMAIYQPEKFVHTPQSLHLYAFVANDPLNKVDPTGLSFWSFVGSVVGVIVGVVVAVAIVAAVVLTGGAAGVLLGMGLALLSGLAVTGVSYLIASNVDPNSAFGQFMRGFMIGFNAGMNGVLATALFGPVVGIVLGVINFLATFDGVARNSVYQGFLGWSSWVMPMSWTGTAIGLIFYVVNLVVAGVTFQQWDAAKIDKLSIDWKTGSIVMVNGLIKNSSAFDLGNFVFINKSWTDNPASQGYDAVLNHEAGHNLNNAAFGPGFGLGDFIGEAISGNKDYGEQMAESHTNRPGRPTIPMWG